MQIKRFEAKNMTAALRLIKGELGPDAVILSARSLRQGKGFFGSMKYAGVEVTAAIDTREGRLISDAAGRRQTAYHKMPNNQPAKDNQAPDWSDHSPAASPAYGRSYPYQKRPNSKVESNNHRAFSLLYQQMLAQEVDRHLASELIDELKRIPAAEDLAASGKLNAHLETILEDMGVRVDRNAFVNVNGNPRVVAFIGTTGVGKTTTIAKLAARQANRRQKQVAVITIDNYGIAANEQLKSYMRIIGIPLDMAVNPAELSRAIKRHQQKDLIFIDTPGINPNSQSQIRELESYFSKLPDLQKHLVVSAATKEKDLRQILQAFQEVGAQRLLFSKIDESKTYGNMLNALIRSHIPLSFFSCGRRVPDDIEAGTIQKLVDLIFQAKNLNPKSSSESPRLKDGRPVEVQRSTGNRSYFVANKNSDIYHQTDCKWSDKIKPENIIQFASNREAETQNFLPCRSCNPDRLKSNRNTELRTPARKFSNYH